jgi:hypothetical protein
METVETVETIFVRPLRKTTLCDGPLNVLGIFRKQNEQGFKGAKAK